MGTPTHYRAYDANGNVFHEGLTDAEGNVAFVAEGNVSHIAFYSGEGDDEVCEGAAEVNASGRVSVNVKPPEPEAPTDQVVVVSNEKREQPPVIASVIAGMADAG